MKSSLFRSVILVAASALRARIVPDGATNTLSNATNTVIGDVPVGTNSSFTLLVLFDHTSTSHHL